MKKKILKILAIDDNLNCLHVIAKFFTLMGGHIVEVAENGADGLKKAVEMHPDFIFLDMVMPDMDGMEVLGKLYLDSRTQEIPVIIITGNRLSDTAYGTLKEKKNFMLLLEKPTDFNQLLNTIEAAI